MLNRLKNWIKTRFSTNKPGPAPDMRATGAHASPRPTATKAPRKNPASVKAANDPAGEKNSLGPGKDVPIRNKYVREDTGTHETLKILDDSLVDSGEETGIDPYNTGGFDRSRNWDKRFGK
jgi:hypothetical protein